MRSKGITVPVRVRILASILVVTALGMVVAGGTSFLLQRERVLAQVDTRLTDTASRLHSVSSATAYTGVRQLLGAAIQQITPDTNEGILGIVDGAATVIPGSEVGLPLEHETALVKRIDRETTGNTVVIGTAVTGQGSLRYIAVPVSVRGDAAQGIYVAAFSIDAELEPIAQAFTTFALVSLAALVVIAIVGWFVAGRLLRPLRRLRETTERITGSDIDERIPVVGHDDVSELTVTVNAMLDRLQDAVLAQRRLLDDVGHELRTPLTILRGHLELMDQNDSRQVAATRALALDEVERLRGLVSDISVLAASSNERAPLLLPSDIGSLTATMFANVSVLPGRKWVLDGSVDAVAELDSEQITQAWLQLAANADRYATPGTPIGIGSRMISTPQGHRVQLWVRDEGPGISPGAHERIFERFGREADGRGQAGSGLGLSIVTAIVRANNGTIALDSDVGRGSTFTIELPAVELPVAESPATELLGPGLFTPGLPLVDRETVHETVPETGESR